MIFRAIKFSSAAGMFITTFLLLFFLIAYSYLKQDEQKRTDQFKTHAAIISDDIWAIDKLGAASYLQLAVQANHYKRLQVTQTTGELMVDEQSLSLEGLDYFLFNIGVISVRNMTTEIIYNSKIIGYLKGEQYVRAVYPLANIFIFLAFVFLMAVFMFHLLINRRKLETLVLERTENLQKSERRFHDFVNLLPEMVWESDRNGGIKYANQVAISRFDLENRIDIPWFELISPEQRTEAGQEFEASMQGKGGGLREFNAMDKNDVTFPLLIRSAPIVQDDEIVGARCVAIDISERHQLEEELHQATKMKAIGLMAGGVAHDLNNILSGLVSYPELILMSLPDDSDMRPPIEAIRKSGVQAAEVVSDLLTVARGIAASRSVQKPNDLIKEYLKSPDFRKLQTGHPQVEYKLDLADDLMNISCSPIHIRKCLMNLVTNATEAIEGNGKVSISSQNVMISEGRPGNPALAEGAYTVISVMDTGSGISDEDLSHIFEPFYTKKMMGRSGTGLGLTVVWNTMRDHDGAVTAESYDGITTFNLYFPGTEDDIAELESITDWQSLKGNKERVLVVDDEKQQREIAGKLLSSLNYQVDTVSSGEDALEYLLEYSVDLLVLDMIMDPGMNGYETYKRACSINPGQKAIIASGFSESEDVKRALKLGAGMYITKPYTIEQIGSAIRKVLSS